MASFGSNMAQGAGNIAASGFDIRKLLGAGGLGAIGTGLGGMFGGFDNPADNAMDYLNQAPDVLKKYLDPYINAGQRALPGLEGQYGQLMNNPGGRMNQIGSQYQQSPGFQFALQQALQGANHAAAAGGMAGSPQHQQQNMQVATGLANQDYNQWLQQALGLYGTGLSGQQGIYNTGAAAGVGLGQDLASILGSQAQLSYEGQNAQNQAEGGAFGSLMGGLGSLGAMLLL
jgi:hypothetical protein